jgi:putative endonuclease
MPETDKQRIGQIGEDLAVRFLVKHKYLLVERNYRKKFGEIDIICRRGGKLYFVEVKTVSRETFSRETGDEYRAEDNIHQYKIKRIDRAIQLYLEERSYDGDWEILVVIIELIKHKKKAKITLLKGFAW